MIQAVLFDMDGLIVDTEPIHFKAFKGMMREYGHEIPESLMAKLVGYPEADNIRDLKAMYKMEAPAEEMASRRYGLFMQLIRVEPIPVFPGFWEFSEEMRRRGIKQAVVSSSTAEQVEVILRRLFEEHADEGSAESHFDAIVTGDDIANNKPSPDIYLEAARRLEAPPAECLALEDTPAGVQAAAAAGMPVVAVPNDYSRGLEFPGAAATLGSLKDAVDYLEA
ncbi:MAG: HAD family phosphatase [Armatimonadota bacterium]|nr:MAG: HAD family phosphatase [Armatimonadota bacterium]